MALHCTEPGRVWSLAHPAMRYARIIDGQNCARPKPIRHGTEINTAAEH